MRRRTVRISALAAAAVCCAFAAFLATRPVAQGATPVDSSLIGTAAPASVTTSLAGSRVALPGPTGHVVVLSFFASWCGPCATEAPELETFAWHLRQTHSTTRLYGVIYSDADAAVRGFVRAYGLSYPVLQDPNGSIAAAYAVTGPPVTVVVGPTGRVAAILEGAVTSAQLDTEVAAAERAA